LPICIEEDLMNQSIFGRAGAQEGPSTRSSGAAISRRDVGRAVTCGGLGALFNSAFGALDADAKKKRDKKQGEKRKTMTVTRTVRGSITQTFSSTEVITVPNGAPGTTKGPASPYPSAIAVGGFPNGVITDVDLLLLDVTHQIAEDLDILLSAPDGRRALVLNDVGDDFKVTNVDLTLDDEAAASVPNFDIVSGTFRPTDNSLPGSPLDPFDAPAPAPDGSVALSTFDGADPNGTWQLWVMDDTTGEVGSIRAWALRITGEVDAGTVEERVPTGKDAKKRRRHR
jgi:subtilisin-like proprotein convertase family protein